VGSKTFGGLNHRLKEKAAESRWFATTGQAPFGRAKAASWKINGMSCSPYLIHAAASFAAFFAFRGLSINESTFCLMVWK
jgi:hypothetical protein